MDKKVWALIALVVVIGIGILAYFQVQKWHRKKLTTAIETCNAECQNSLADIQNKLADLESELTLYDQNRLYQDIIADVFGEDTVFTKIGGRDVDCAEINRQMMLFFRYLDKKSYIADAKMEATAFEAFEESLVKLSQKKPVLTNEMEDIFTLIHNVTHFYRILGLKRVKLIKQILTEESEVIEPVMAIIAARLLYCAKGGPQASVTPSLETMYHYAGFFLNTLGGRSYLLRRDSRVRMLVSYYALLILDRANIEKRNTYGLDIRPYIEYLFYDISNQRGLMYRERYLSELAALQNKYF
jgi:hypothetical protein